ncbi:MAG: hypothetical protein HYX34_00185 [Actinobacteria bacterium]|nr:hypothetical protein [Actinomycetota bacterium]
MDMGRGPKTFFALALGFFALIVVIGAVSTPRDASASSSVGTSRGTYSTAVVRQDSAMTQQMSVNNANGPMQRYQVTDPQLQHSADPAFVASIEQYQGEVNRMLALAAP